MEFNDPYDLAQCIQLPNSCTRDFAESMVRFPVGRFDSDAADGVGQHDMPGAGIKPEVFITSPKRFGESRQ